MNEGRMSTESYMRSMGSGYRKLWREHGIQLERIKPDDNVPCIGISEKEQKWYGWSHRAIFGFGIGYTVKKGHSGFIADNPEELIEDHANFFADISPALAEEKRAECAILDDRSGILILHTPLKIRGIDASGGDMAKAAEKLAEVFDDAGNVDDLPEMTLYRDCFSIQECGRGQWTSKTLEDCKAMAIEFAKSVG